MAITRTKTVVGCQLSVVSWGGLARSWQCFIAAFHWLNSLRRQRQQRIFLTTDNCQLTTLLISLLILSPAVLSQPGSESLDAIIAVVNDDVVVRSELNKEINLVLPQLRQQGTAEPPRAQLEKQVLDRLILKRLQRQRAKELGIEIDDATLNEAVTNIAKRNNLSIEDLQRTLEAGGIRFADFRDDTRSQILTNRLQSQEVVSKIRVTEPEIDRFLAKEAGRLVEREQVRLQHILLALPDNPTPEQLKTVETKANRLVAELRRGADFSGDGGARVGRAQRAGRRRSRLV